MKSPAKINVFLKITGKKNGYHELISRFVRIDELFDEVFLIPKKLAKNYHEKLVDETNFSDFSDDFSKIKSIQIENALPKTSLKTTDLIMDRYYLLNDNLVSNFDAPNNIFDKVLSLVPSDLATFFRQNYAIFLHKNIPTFAGCGGASSNAATFIKLLNNIWHFNTKKIASLSGADVSFFESGFSVANVSGYGEKISEFKEDKINFKLYFSSNSSTKEVFNEFSKNPVYYDKTDLLELTSQELLSNFSNYFLNDLLNPCINLYPKALSLAQKGLFLSGSGGTFFNFSK